MHHVFISYSRRDLDRVRPVLRRLDLAQIPYWVDTSDIPISVAWDQEISRAITASTLVAYFNSNAWRTSRNCQSEFDRARSANRPLLQIPTGPGFDATAAVERIQSEYAATLATQRPYTELSFRANEWDVRGRSGSRLASPKQVKEFRRLAPDRLPAVAGEYLRASRRRNRRRKTIASLGAILTLTLFGVLRVLPKAGEKANDQLNQATQKLVDLTKGQDALRYNIYDALTRAAGRITPDDVSFIHLSDLTTALSVKVPDSKKAAAPEETPVANEVEATSADGTLTASGHAGSAAIDINTKSELTHRVVLASTPNGLAFSPDGRELAATVGNEVDVVSVSQGAVMQTLRGSPGDLWAPTWSADGKSISASTANSGVLSWTWRDGDVLLEDDSWITNGVALPDDGFVALTRSGELIINDHGTLTRHQTPVAVAAWLSASRDGKLLAVSDTSSVDVYDRASGSDRQIDVPNCHVAGTGFDPAATHLYVACEQDGLVELDLSSGTVSARIKTNSDDDVLPYSVAVAGNGEVFTGGYHGILAEYPASLSSYRTILSSTSQCWSPRDSIAVSASADALVSVGDGGSLLGCTLMAVRHGDSWAVNVVPVGDTSARQARAVAINASGTLAAIGYGDGSVSTLLIPDGNPGLSWHEVTSAVRGLGFRSDGSLTVASRDGMIQTMPACPSCDDPLALAKVAEQRVAQAKTWGLTN